LIKRFGDLTGKLCYKAYMKRNIPCETCQLKKAFRTGKTQKCELEAPDGRIYEITSTPFKDIDGKRKAIEVVRDITDFKKTEEKIRVSEKRFRELFDHMSSGVAIYEATKNGKDFIFKDINKAGEKIENLKRKIIIGRSVLEVFPGIKEFGLFDVFKRVWKTGKPEHHPVTFYKDKRIEGWRENYVYKLPTGEIVAVYDDVTARKKAQEKLKESEKRFRESIMNAPLPVMIHKENGKVVSVNKAWTEISGYTLDEIPTIEEWTKKAYDISKKLVKKTIDKLYKIKGRVEAGEFEIKTKSGTKRTWLFSSAPLGKLPDGMKIIISMALDITERKERAKEYKNLIDGMNDTAFVISFEGKFVEVNDTASEVLGYTREELLGMGPTDIDSHLSSDDIGNLIEDMKKEDKQIFPTEHKTRDGHIIPVEISSSRIMYNGKPHILSIARDITKRKEAEEALRESEERFQTVIENLPEEIFVHDLNGKFILVNKTSCEHTGYTKDELLQMKVSNIDPESDSRNDRKNIWSKLQKEGGFLRIESTHLCKDGSTYPVEIYFSSLTFKGKSMIAVIAHDITKRKKALGELKESEERFQMVIENLPHGVCLHDLNGYMTLVNKALCELTSYSEEELLTMNVQEVDHQSVSRDDRQNLWLKLNKGGHDHVESILHRKDGSTFPAVIYLNAINLKEKPMILAITQDITERKKAVEKLKESEERFQTVIEHLPHAVSVHDLNGNFILVNETLRKQTGYTREELKKMTIKGIDPHSQTRNDRNKIWLSLKKGGHTHFESELLSKDGSCYPVEVYLNAITLEGSPMILAIAQDISDRKKALENLQKSEEKYRKLHESMRDAFVRANMEGKLIEFNKHFLDMLGYNQKEIKNVKWKDITPDKWHEMEKNIMKEEILKKGYSEAYEKEYIKKDGTIIPIEIRAFLLKNSNNKPEGMWAIVRDISERKKTEEELRKIERLESLGVLAGGIAHDFNNLLTGILGNISLVQAEKTDDFEKILGEVKEAAIKAKNLTQQLLTFSKGGEPIKGIVDIEELIKNSAAFALHGSNVKCEYHFTSNLWKIEADRGQLSQVIDNLVINANQSMPAGGKVHVKAENVILEKENLLLLPEGRYVKITFRDEGIGIPEKYLQKIFDPYFSTKQEGSGLGLATVYSVVQKHGGYITVESQTGKGTSFFIYLPAIEEKKVKKRKKKESKKTLTEEGKMLIMDDEKIVRKAVGGMLQKLGYTVEFAEKGEEAISKYKKAMNSGKPFDAVILDLTVPGGMGGKNTMEELLRIDPDVKAIVSSGYSTDPVMANHKKYGFKAVVAKPFDLKDLNETIKKVLG
jgi:PAS domain S-box-containing protein